MRILVSGNSRSGKSTLCVDLTKLHSLHHLDLDTIVWEPGTIAVPRPPRDVLTLLNLLLGAFQLWVVFAVPPRESGLAWMLYIPCWVAALVISVPVLFVVRQRRLKTATTADTIGT